MAFLVRVQNKPFEEFAQQKKPVDPTHAVVVEATDLLSLTRNVYNTHGRRITTVSLQSSTLNKVSSRFVQVASPLGVFAKKE